MLLTLKGCMPTQGLDNCDRGRGGNRKSSRWCDWPLWHLIDNVAKVCTWAFKPDNSETDVNARSISGRQWPSHFSDKSGHLRSLYWVLKQQVLVILLQADRNFKRRSHPIAALRIHPPEPPPKATFPQSQAASLHRSLSGGFLSFTHPNEQLREINASNCQTIKSNIRGRIPQPPALRAGLPIWQLLQLSIWLNQISSLSVSS